MNQRKTDNPSKDIFLAILFFLLSFAITWWFIERSGVYESLQQKIISCAIAGGKWTLQILAALFFLRRTRWVFIKLIGLVCLIGSIILVPAALIGSGSSNQSTLFLCSLIAAVLMMIYAYRHAVLALGLSWKWWYGWLVCLAIAITLQLTLVFHTI